MFKKIAIVLCFWWGNVQAADLQVFLRAAVQTHPDVADAEAAMEEAQQRQKILQAALEPQLRLQLEQNYAWMAQDFARSSVQLLGTWTLWQPQLSEQIQAATDIIAQSRAKIEAVRQELLWRVVESWVKWQRVQRSIKYERARQRILTQLLEQVREGYSAGQGQLAKVALLARRQAESQARLRQLQWQAEQLKAQVRALTGRDDLTVVSAPPLTEQHTEQPDWQANPRMQVLRAAVAATMAQQAAEQSRYSGQLSVFAAGVHNDSGGRFYDDMEGVRIGVRYEVPLWTSGGIESSVSQYKSRQRALQAQQASLQRTLQQLWDQAQAILTHAPA